MVLDGLNLNDPEYTFSRIMHMMSKSHPKLVHLFDKFHSFVNTVGGMAGHPTDYFWAKGELKGKKYLVGLVKEALQEELESIPLAEVASLPFSKHDFRDIVEPQDTPTPTMNIKQETVQDFQNEDKVTMTRRLNIVVKFIQAVNKENKFYRLILPKKNETAEWLSYPIDLFVDAAWQNIHLVDTKRPMIRYATELSVTQWIDKVSVSRDVSAIKQLLDGKERSSTHVEEALLKATDSRFSAAFQQAMSVARTYMSGLSVLSRDFIELITENIQFKRLVAWFYTSSVSTNNKFGSVKSMQDHIKLKSISIQSFVDSITGTKSWRTQSSPFSMLPPSSSLKSVHDFFPEDKSIIDILIP